MSYCFYKTCNVRLCFVAGIIVSSGFFVFFQFYPPTDFICVPSKLTLVCQKPTYSRQWLTRLSLSWQILNFIGIMVSGHHIATDLFLYVHHLRITICYTFHFEFLMNMLLKMFKVLLLWRNRQGLLAGCTGTMYTIKVCFFFVFFLLFY